MSSQAHDEAIDIDGVTVTRSGLSGRHIDADEITKLLYVCRGDPSPAGDRDAAIIAMAYAGGLRRSEIAMMTLGKSSEAIGNYAAFDAVDCEVLIFNKRKERVVPTWLRQHIDLKKALLTRLALDDFLATYEADPAGTLRRLYELEQNEIERGDEWRRNGRSVGLEEKFGG